MSTLLLDGAVTKWSDVMGNCYRSSPQPHLAQRCGECRCQRAASDLSSSRGSPHLGFREKPWRWSFFRSSACISSCIDAHTHVCHRMREQIGSFIKWFAVLLPWFKKKNSSGRKWFKIDGNCAKSGTDLVATGCLEKSSPHPVLGGGEGAAGWYTGVPSLCRDKLLKAKGVTGACHCRVTGSTRGLTEQFVWHDS